MKTLELFYDRHNFRQGAGSIDHQLIRYYELTVVLRGELSYEVDGEKCVLSAGDAVFVRPDSVRTRDAAEDVDYLSFNFRSDEEFAIPTFTKSALTAEARLLIEAYDRINGEYYFNNNEKNEHILACLISIFEDRVRFEDLDPLTVKITSYVNANFAKRITLNEIGRITFFSPIYCDTVFKRETGRSIIDYLLERRIDEAKKHLMDATLPLGRIAELCGFSDYNYFCRVFKKRTGTTPTAYRKAMTGESDRF